MMLLRQTPLLARDFTTTPTPVIEPFLTEEQNETIEDWYTDPYERPTASGPAGEQRRRHNMIKQFQERGFHRNRAILAADYLMKSKGVYKDDEQIRAESRAAVAARHKTLKQLSQRRRAARRQAEKEARKAAKGLETQRKEFEKKRREQEKNGVRLRDRPMDARTVIETTATTDRRLKSEPSLSDDTSTDLIMPSLSEASLPIGLTRIAQHIQFTTDTTELDNVSDHQLARRTNAVKSALHKFALLYGEAGLPPPTTEIQFNHMRGGPVPVPNIQYRSQGHERIMKVTIGNKEVYGEEGVFDGLGPDTEQLPGNINTVERPGKPVEARIKKENPMKKVSKQEPKWNKVALLDDLFEAEAMRYRDLLPAI